MKYTVTVKDKVIIDELDFLLQEQLFPGMLDGDDDFPDEVNIGQKETDSEPIKIDNLISYLEDLKENGSNYVSIEPDYDHFGYILEGLDIQKSD